MRQLLSDVFVVELSTEAAGEYCGKVFADLGADVVKVERVGGDPLRGRPGAFAHLNTNKRSVVLGDSPTHDEARLWDLIGRANLVIQTLGVDEGAISTDWNDALDRFPSLVVTTISGFGTSGPYASYRWSDLVAQVVSSSVYPQGRSDVVPVKVPGMAGLCTIGHTAALGALAAVLRARASGVGTHVDCAAYEALGTSPSRAGRFLGYEYNGREPLPSIASGTANTLIPTGVFPCSDGYVSMMSTPQQLTEMLSVIDDDALTEAFARPDAFVRPETKEILDAALYPWLFSHTRAELTARAQAAGWPLAGLNTPQEALDADHLHQRGFWVSVIDPTTRALLIAGAPYRHAEGGWRVRRPAPSLGEHDAEIAGELHVRASERAPLGIDPELPPLHGVRVLDITTVWSGPYLTQLLADLGAEVIRLENPSVFPPTTKGYLPRPDRGMMLGPLLSMYAPPAPGHPDRPYNRHAMNNSIARNKLSCTLDPRGAEGRELFMRLVELSDVFIENLKASTLHHIGIQEGELLERNPRLLVLRVPPAGLTGDWASYTGFGAQFDGLSGFSFLTGHHDSEMVETPATTYMDAATGSAGAFAVVAGLHYRAATGRGQVIELAQMENSLNHLGDVFVDLQLGIEPRRVGNRDPHHAPQGVYQCRGEQRWLGITVSDDQDWAALAGAIGHIELADDPRFARTADRYAHHDELDELIGAWAADHDVMEAFHTLQGAGVIAGPLLDEELLSIDPHVAARGWLRPLASRDVGTHLHIGYAFQGLPQTWWRGSPVLGEDNDYVYKKLLGLDDDYERLVAEKIIVDDYLDPDGNPV